MSASVSMESVYKCCFTFLGESYMKRHKHCCHASGKDTFILDGDDGGEIVLEGLHQLGQYVVENNMFHLHEYDSRVIRYVTTMADNGMIQAKRLLAQSEGEEEDDNEESDNNNDESSENEEKEEGEEEDEDEDEESSDEDEDEESSDDSWLDGGENKINNNRGKGRVKRSTTGKGRVDRSTTVLNPKRSLMKGVDEEEKAERITSRGSGLSSGGDGKVHGKH